MLLAAGAKVGNVDVLGQSALMYAAAGGNADCIVRLLDAGAKVDARCEDGKTALMHAAGSERLACVQALLAAGADAALKTLGGEIANDYCCEGSNIPRMLEDAQNANDLASFLSAEPARVGSKLEAKRMTKPAKADSVGLGKAEALAGQKIEKTSAR